MIGLVFGNFCLLSTGIDRLIMVFFPVRLAEELWSVGRYNKIPEGPYLTAHLLLPSAAGVGFAVAIHTSVENSQVTRAGNLLVASFVKSAKPFWED